MAYIDKISPTGFHVLTKAEALNMIAAVGGVLDVGTGGYTEGGKLKAEGTLNWAAPNTGATNESGFAGIGSGERSSFGMFGDLTMNGWIWVYDESDPEEYTYMYLINTSDQVLFYSNSDYGGGLNDFGASVRLASDTPETFMPGDTFTDLNGNIYPLVKIGDVVVMAENLRTDKYANGDPIPLAQGVDEWINADGAYCVYDTKEPQYIIFALQMELQNTTYPASFIIARIRSLQTGALTLAGGNLTALKTRLFTLSTGVIALSMKPANITTHKTYSMSTGSFGLTGNDTNIFVTTETSDKPVIGSESTLFLSDNRVGVIAWVTPNGITTLLQLQYGTTTAYGTNITIDGISGVTPVAISDIIPRLIPGNYHYRIVASNVNGTAYGDDHPFTIYPGVGRDLIDYSTILSDGIASMTGTTYYIDPSAAVNGNGLTEETPFNTWTVFANLGGYNKFLQKRGTTYTSATGIFRNFNGPCYMGVYGSGTDYAYIEAGASTSSDFVSSYGRLIIQDYDIKGYRTGGLGTEVGVGLRVRSATSGSVTNHIVYHCRVHGFQYGIDGYMPSGSYQYGMKVLHCEIYDTARDGMYPNATTDMELAYNYIHDVNNAWYIDQDQRYSSADGIQINFANINYPTVHMTASLHHNTIDRSSTGNKFCMLWNEQMNDESVLCFNNHFICPVYGTYAGHPVSSIYTSFQSATDSDTSNTEIYNNRFEGGEYGVRNYCRLYSKIHHNIFNNQLIGIATGTGNAVQIYNNVFHDYIQVAIGMTSFQRVYSKNNSFTPSTLLTAPLLKALS